MTRPLRTTHPRKRATTAHKFALLQHGIAQGTDNLNRDPEPPAEPPLWKQVRALEQANAALRRTNDTLALESAQQQRRIADLGHDMERQRAQFAADRARRSKQASITLGDLQKTLHEKHALEEQLADARAQRRTWQVAYEERRAAAARLEAQRARSEAEMRIVRAQLAHDKLESKIHRCAAQVAHQTFDDPDDRRKLLDILKRCRVAFTRSDAPPPPRPASPEPRGADAGVIVVVEDEPQQQQDLVYTPQRPTGQPLTPESMTRGQGSPASYLAHRTPRRGGLRPRARYVDSNGSPWNTRTYST